MSLFVSCSGHLSKGLGSQATQYRRGQVVGNEKQNVCKEKTNQQLPLFTTQLIE